VTPVGTVQSQVTTEVNRRIVNPPLCELVGEQATFVTTNENVAVEVPFGLVAVIVMEREAKVPDGVPDISPVEVLKLKPIAVIAVESAEGIEYEVTGPPELEIE
jgi:hypothetical protein